MTRKTIQSEEIGRLPINVLDMLRDGDFTYITEDAIDYLIDLVEKDISGEVVVI